MNQLDLRLPGSTYLVFLLVGGLAALGVVSLLSTGQPLDRGLVPVAVITGVMALTLATRTRAAVDSALSADGYGWSLEATDDVSNAAAGREALAREFAAAQRGRTLTVVLLRIEEVGRYHAEHGKTVTDQLIRDAGRVLARHRRDMHLVARYGRDAGTFLAVLSGVDGKGGAVYATRVRRRLMALTGLPTPRGVNAGVAVFDVSMESPGELLKRAEFALGKGAERGKVVVVGETGD